MTVDKVAKFHNHGPQKSTKSNPSNQAKTGEHKVQVQKNLSETHPIRHRTTHGRNQDYTAAISIPKQLQHQRY